MFESVDARMPARVPSYKLTLWAFGSGELKSEKRENKEQGKTLHEMASSKSHKATQ